MNKYISYLIALFLLVQVFPVSSAFAINTPSFPSCTAPTGNLVVSYSNGTHGIVGREGAFIGRDSVYQVNSDQLIQCYCPNAGNGIQTNWLKVSSISENDLQVYKSEGWILIPDGSSWGLSSESYIAKNVEFACTSSNVGGSSDGKSDGMSDGKSTGSGSTKSVLGALTSLASTGNIASITGLLGFGIFSLGLSYILSKRQK